jgi:hypothetical protein
MNSKQLLIPLSVSLVALGSGIALYHFYFNKKQQRNTKMSDQASSSSSKLATSAELTAPFELSTQSLEAIIARLHEEMNEGLANDINTNKGTLKMLPSFVGKPRYELEDTTNDMHRCVQYDMTRSE